MATHFFTSAAVNYLPKARVLADSVRRHHPGGVFHLVLCDVLPSWFRLEEEPFDVLWTLDDLELPAEPGWLFSHNLVELSTAVKGFALIKILSQPDCESVVYFDPDIVALAPLEKLLAEFEAGSILLTPHSTEPDHDRKVIEDNEIVSLRHGTFNLGFLGVKNDGEGRRFSQWWRDRLREFCFDDVPFGLFTDQRWADLVPSFFPAHRILTDAAYNVCTWNLNSRVVTGNLQDGLLVNGQPMVFYHFSGLDRGAQKAMLQRYGRGMPPLFDLRSWYKDACEKAGQSILGAHEWGLSRFPNGEPILQSQRDVYHRDPRVRQWFPDPCQTSGPAPSFVDWYRLNGELFTPPRPPAPRTGTLPESAYRVVVVAKNGNVPSLERLAAVTAAADSIRVVGEGEAEWSQLLAECSGCDLAVIRSDLEPPWHWDQRLAWSAERNPDALTISPIVVSENAATGQENLDRLAYWLRLSNDPEIARPFEGCYYLRTPMLRNARGEGRHRLATHVCLTSDGDASPEVSPLWFANEIRAYQTSDDALPRLTAVANAPVLHIVSASGEQAFQQYCCSDDAHDHVALVARGHAKNYGTSFRLSRYRCREADSPLGIVVHGSLELEVERLEGWSATIPIRTAALSHTSYQAALNDVFTKFRPGKIVVWSLLGHSLDCLQTGLPTAVIADSIGLSQLLAETKPVANASVLRRELDRLLKASAVSIFTSSQSVADNFSAVVPGCSIEFVNESFEQSINAPDPVRPEAERYFAGPRAPAPQPAYALQLYWDSGNGFHEGASATAVPRITARQRIALTIPPLPHAIQGLRLDIGTEPLLVNLFGLCIFDAAGESLWEWNPKSTPLCVNGDGGTANQIFPLHSDETSSRLGCIGSDSHFVLPLEATHLSRLREGATLAVDVEFDSRSGSLQGLLDETAAAARLHRLNSAHAFHLLRQQLTASEGNAAEARLQIDRLTARCAAVEQALQGVTRSSSWRLTKPLRFAKRLLGSDEKTGE